MNTEQKQIIFGIAFLILLALTGFLFRTQIEAFLRANHLLPEPEPLTELYFEDHINLPKTFSIGVPQTVKFTIHNVMYKPMTYTIDVSAKTATSSTTIQTGDVILAHDAFKTLSQDITLTEATRTAVIVALNTGEKIQVWLEPQYGK